MKKYKQMKVIFNTSRFLIGVIFMFSGFVKVVDPLGSMYKFIDYFNLAFNIPWMEPWAFSLALIMSVVEFAVGLTLILGVNMVITSWLALFFLLLFTPILLYIAITNSIHDCGCFGDAIVLSNWQTFWKNIILFVPAIFIFVKNKTFKSIFSIKIQWIITILIFAVGFTISFYCIKHLPIIDFRPYHIGANITEYMATPDDAPKSVFETSLIYTNSETGEKKEFDLNNIPSAPWEWYTTINIEVEKGYVPKIQNFSIQDEEKGNILDIVLADTNYNIWFVAYDISKTSLKAMQKGYRIAELAKAKGINFYALTSSSPFLVDSIKKLLIESLELKGLEEPLKPVYQTIYTAEKNGDIEEYIKEDIPSEEDGWSIIEEEQRGGAISKSQTEFAMKFYFCDDIPLKTMIRANPGILLIKKGIVVNKWAAADFPEIADWENMLNK